MEPIVVTYVQYSYAANTKEAREVTSRDPQQAAKEAPARALKFTYYDAVTAEVEVGGQTVALFSRPYNFSEKQYYIDATLLSYDEVKALPDNAEFRMIKQNLYPGEMLVRCRNNLSIQVYDPKNDVLVSTR